MRLGTKGASGTGPNHFNLPTDVAFAPNGDVYVSDGYGSARLVKYSRVGKYLLRWGTRGKGPGEFGLPHNVVVDAQSRVYVTDRDDERIEIFDSNGKFLDQWTGTGGISELVMTKDHRIWTVESCEMGTEESWADCQDPERWEHMAWRSRIPETFRSTLGYALLFEENSVEWRLVGTHQRGIRDPRAVVQLFPRRMR